jgi:cytochrome d ubiquinol oxidase subunit II
MAVSFWPFVIPYSFSIDQVTAPPRNLHLIFWENGLCIVPQTIGYTAMVCRIFQGKNFEVGCLHND